MSRSPFMLIVAFACLCLAVGPFEGTKWKIKLSPDEDAIKAGEKEFDVTLTFKGNKFSAEAPGKFSFKPVSYEEDVRQFGPATFKAETTNDTDGSVKWSGTIAAVAVRGEVIWTKKNGKTVNFAYQGERTEKQ